jgi:hypothetical protein
LFAISAVLDIHFVNLYHLAQYTAAFTAAAPAHIVSIHATIAVASVAINIIASFHQSRLLSAKS